MQAYICKIISPANLRKRTEYGREHQGKTVDSSQRLVYFTDEAHIDPSSETQGHILRKQGTRYDAENIQQRPEKIGVKVTCSWMDQLA